MRRAWISLLSMFCLFGAMGLNAQEQVNQPKAAETKKDEKADTPLRRFGGDAFQPRPSIEMSGYTRPGNPGDKIGEEGKIIPASGFVGTGLQKFKIMGGTVYFVVFKNMGIVEGDTFGTGMANFDNRFQEGRSFTNSVSPRFDKRARYLYLYQVVNDRNLDPRLRPATEKKKGDVGFAVDDAKTETKLPVADDIASLAVKLLVDPRYITSWGHFTGAGFAANVVDVNESGKPVKTIAFDNGKKIEQDREIRLAVSFAPAILTKITHTQYESRARSYPLNDLGAGFGVDNATINLKDTKATSELKQAAGVLTKDGIKWASTNLGGRLKATESANEPDYVQLMYLSSEERLAANNVNNTVPTGTANVADDDITRAIFRADWRQSGTIKQGRHSVVIGFTSDLPPTNAPVRIDTPSAALRSEGLRLASYFADSAVERAGAAGTGTGTGTGTGIVPTVGTGAGQGIVPAAAGAEGGALALALGTALGQAASPVPAPAEGGGGAGFAGITGGAGGAIGGGMPMGGGGGGLGFPGISGMGFARPGMVTGGGGGVGGGTGSGGGTGTTGNNNTTTPGNNSNSNQNANAPSINFNATLINQQQQGQFQIQTQDQSQSQSNHGHGHGHGNVVPAPASLLLGLLGLPGLFLLRRRKNEPAAAV